MADIRAAVDINPTFQGINVMGKQIRLYLSRQDSEILERELVALEPSILLESWSRGPFPQRYSKDAESESGRRNLFLYLVRQDDVGKVITEEITTQGRWSLLDLYSPVVELTRSGDADNVLRSGRLYYIESYFDEGGHLVCKNDEFRNWARRVMSKARRLLTYDKELSAYLGAEAIEIQKSGIPLV